MVGWLVLFSFFGGRGLVDWLVWRGEGLGFLFGVGGSGGCLFVFVVVVCWGFLLFFYSREKFSELLRHVERRGCIGGRPEA